MSGRSANGASAGVRATGSARRSRPRGALFRRWVTLDRAQVCDMVSAAPGHRPGTSLRDDELELVSGGRVAVTQQNGFPVLSMNTNSRM